jgi:outer membrane protein OmpA-like peptidoglycan-associated protein
MWPNKETSMSLLKTLSLVLVFAVLAACQTMHGLNKKQIKTLQQQGFILTDDDWSLALPERLLFASNESAIKPETQANLKILAQQLQQVGILRLNINGHTDSTGIAEFNQELSQKRAATVAMALFAGGLPATEVHTRGMADKQPIASNDTLEGRAENRRVTIIVVP